MAGKKKEESSAVVRGIQGLLNSDLVKSMRKKHGNAIGGLPKDVFKFQGGVKRIPTGIFPLDYGLGGGLPVGRISIFFGPNGSSKTSSLLRGLGRAQKMCPLCWTYIDHPVTGEHLGCECGQNEETVCALVDVEQSYSEEWGERLGVDNNRLFVSTPEYGEEAGDVIEGLLRSGQVHVLMLDSLVALVPSAEIEKSLEDGMMGDQARLISRLFKKIMAALAACEREHGFKPTVAMTNQIRFKLGVMHGNPETMPGGEAPKFYASCIVRLRAMKYEQSTTEEGMLGADAVNIEFKVHKNKSGGRQHTKSEFQMCLRDMPELNKYMGDVADEDIFAKFAKLKGLLQNPGKGQWNWPQSSHSTREKAIQWLRENPLEYHNLKNTLMENLLSHATETKDIRRVLPEGATQPET